MERKNSIPRTLLPQIRALGLNPIDLVLYVNSECNLRCKHCYIGNKILRSAVYYDKEDVTRFINSFEKLDRLILLGGEPFLYEGFADLLNRLDLERITELRVTTNLNSISILQDFSADVLKKIRLNFSLDGPDKLTHEFIRGKDTFDITCRNLEAIMRLGLDVELTHTLMTTNIHSFENLLDLCRKLGIKKLNLHRMSLHGNALMNRELQVSPTQYVELCKKIDSLATQDGSIELRYPVLFMRQEEFDQLVADKKYHSHAMKSYHGEGIRIVVYPTREIFISSELFGTEAFIGTFDDEKFHFNNSAKNELVFPDQNNIIPILNPDQSGDENYPVVLSVSYKKIVRI